MHEPNVAHNLAVAGKFIYSTHVFIDAVTIVEAAGETTDVKK